MALHRLSPQQSADLYELILFLDDLGCLHQRAQESEVLFTLITERYERRSQGITSNLVFSGKEGPAQPGYERGRQRVEDAVAAFFDSDYWGLVNAVRAEFGLPVSSPEGQVPSP